MMIFPEIQAISHPNIAFVKYWGNQNDLLNIPSNGSISMNLGSLETKTSVRFSPDLEKDKISINRISQSGKAYQKVIAFLDIIRGLAGISEKASVSSSNNFPMGAGIASSASGFAALALAGSKAAGLNLSEVGLSRLARQGAGSASRSIPTGFVEWYKGNSDETSFSRSIAPQDHWNLIDLVAISDSSEKEISSSKGHQRASSSPLQAGRIATAKERLDICRTAIIKRDFDALAEVTELESNLLHAVMMTSNPNIHYWNAASIQIMQYIKKLRKEGYPVCYTLDAGPNVHIICHEPDSNTILEKIRGLPHIQEIKISSTGGATRLL